MLRSKSRQRCLSGNLPGPYDFSLLAEVHSLMSWAGQAGIYLGHRHGSSNVRGNIKSLHDNLGASSQH